MLAHDSPQLRNCPLVRYRNLFLASDDGDELVAWLNAVRHNKAIELGLSPEMAEEGASSILKQL